MVLALFMLRCHVFFGDETIAITIQLIKELVDISF